MPKPDLPEESVEEFRRVLGEQELKSIRDKNGVFRIRGANQGLSEKISFPSSAYGSQEIDLDSFWVYCRAKLVIKLLRKNKVNTIWEVGAGEGRVSIPLSRAGITVITSEPHYEGAQTLAKNNILVCKASLIELNLKDGVLSALGMFDVLEHIEDTTSFLQEINRIMKPGSLLFLTVPSYEWLFSDFDSAIGHYRRYSRKSLTQELKFAGFKPVEVRFFFASLVIPALILRRIPFLLGRRKPFNGEGGIKVITDDQIAPSPAINKFLKTLLSLESRFKFPFGLSLLGVFEKV